MLDEKRPANVYNILKENINSHEKEHMNVIFHIFVANEQGSGKGKHYSFIPMNKRRILFFAFCLSYLFSGCHSPAQSPESKAVTTNRQEAWEKHLDSLNLQKGKIFIERSEYDSARAYLQQSAQSPDIPLRTESYLYLNSLEVHLGNYDTALIYLGQYHENAMLLFKRAIEAEENAQKNEEAAHRIQYRNNMKLQIAILVSAILLFFILTIIYFQHKKLFIFAKSKRAELKKLDTLIRSKKEEKQVVGYSAYLLQADIFMQTPMYAEIKYLGNQRKNGQDIIILTYEKQDYLQSELERIFANFRNDLTNCGANLTANDIKLCCLSLLPINTFTKAICFGSSETSIIKQRKHYIKKKMTEESENALFFDFIFTSRL